MASSPITSCEIDGKIVEIVSDFISWAPKSLWSVSGTTKLKKRLLHGRKAMTNLGSTLKCRGITLPRKVPIVKAMVFPVVMYGCESWTVQKAER